jgi:hypothetical protein
MRRQQLKRQVTLLLREEELVQIKKQCATFNQRSLINPLISCLCYTDEKIRWHCVSVIGEVVHKIAVDEMENARIVMRRFLWMLNDESGGIGWGVPEAMSESMYHNRILAEEYMHMLVSYSRDDGSELFQDGNFIELPLLQHGVLWGLCRLAENYKEQLIHREVHENLGFYLTSEDSQVRGLASLLCGLLERTEFVSPLKSLIGDSSGVRIYSDGTMRSYTVGQLAGNAVEALYDARSTGLEG